MLDRQQIERIGLEEALRRMPAAAVVAEAPSGKLILINERARRMLERNAGWSGLPEPEGIGDFGDLKMFRPDGRPVEMEEWPLVRSIRSGEEVRDEEQSYLLADGSRLTIRSDSSPIHDDEGRIVAGVLIVRELPSASGPKKICVRVKSDSGPPSSRPPSASHTTRPTESC